MGWTTMRTAWPPSTPAEDKYRNLCEKGLRTPDRAVPDIVPPQVTLTATYPGKDPEVIETTVAQPIEQGV
jgi:AcrB/AcrD/AcrF family